MIKQTKDVGLKDAVKVAVERYAEFNGTSTRAEFWWVMLFVVLVGLAFGALNQLTTDGSLAIGTALASIWGIATLLPMLAVTVRRLRDAGFPWIELLWLLVPIAGLIVLGLNLSRPSKK